MLFLRRGVELLPSGKWGVKHDPLTHKALKIAGFAVVPPPPTLVPGVVPGSAQLNNKKGPFRRSGAGGARASLKRSFYIF